MQDDDSRNRTESDGPRCSSVAQEQGESAAKDLPKYKERPATPPLHRRRGRREWMQCHQCAMWFAADADKVVSGERKFCDRQCSIRHTIATGKFKDDNNPRWMGGVSNDNMRYRRRQMAKEPVQEAARRAVNAAIRSGQLVRQPCEKCGATPGHGHHDDYGKPLDVRWLCRACHAAHHAHERSLRRPEPVRQGAEPQWKRRFREALAVIRSGK